MSTDTIVGFAKRLRHLMAAADMSPRELARQADVAEATVYRHLSATRTQPESATISAYARALGVSADELLGIAPPEQREVPVGELVNIPFAAGTPDAGEMIMVPEIALPPDVPRDQLVAARTPDDACHPDLSPDDLAIIATDWPWVDGDLLAVLVSERLMIRRAYHEGDGALVIGTTPADRQTVPPDLIIGRVMRSIRSH